MLMLFGLCGGILCSLPVMVRCFFLVRVWLSGCFGCDWCVVLLVGF